MRFTHVTFICDENTGANGSETKFILWILYLSLSITSSATFAIIFRTPHVCAYAYQRMNWPVRLYIATGVGFLLFIFPLFVGLFYFIFKYIN
jgi:ABC-type maltose transport system permease subunit